jgi:tetratricopeptide (TPR) repeat protein
MTRELACAVLALVLTSTSSSAQRTSPREPLRESPPPMATRAACVAQRTPPAPSAEQQRRARDLAQRGQQAALLGDRAAARDQLRQAAVLDPTNVDLAYQLARAEEGAGSDADAARAYCHYIALAPDAPEAAESRARLAQLMLSTRHADSLRAAAEFAHGIAAYRRGHPDSADAAFTAALALAPDWPAAYYDRGVVRDDMGRRGDAARDFQQFLRLEPDASSRPQVAKRITILEEPPLSPGKALALGLVVPGAGQFYTGRPVRGTLTLIGAGAALACGMSARVSDQPVQQTATDPFGNPYTFTTTQRVTDHPCRAPGFTAAGVVALMSAIDAFRYARR